MCVVFTSCHPQESKARLHDHSQQLPCLRPHWDPAVLHIQVWVLVFVWMFRCIQISMDMSNPETSVKLSLNAFFTGPCGLQLWFSRKNVGWHCWTQGFSHVPFIEQANSSCFLRLPLLKKLLKVKILEGLLGCKWKAPNSPPKLPLRINSTLYSKVESEKEDVNISRFVEDTGANKIENLPSSVLFAPVSWSIEPVPSQPGRCYDWKF